MEAAFAGRAASIGRAAPIGSTCGTSTGCIASFAATCGIGALAEHVTGEALLEGAHIALLGLESERPVIVVGWPTGTGCIAACASRLRPIMSAGSPPFVNGAAEHWLANPYAIMSRSPSTRSACCAIAACPATFGWARTSCFPNRTGSIKRIPAGLQASCPYGTRAMST